MKQEKVEKTRKDLLTLRDEIIKVIRGQEKESLSREAVDEIDEATALTEDMMGAAVSSNYRENLKKVDEALKRIENGEYGMCENCGAEIPPARLKVLPFTLYCTQCQEELEREEEVVEN